METQTATFKIININTSSVLCGTAERYILVGWPEIQDFMNHPRWSECIFCMEIEGHPCPDNAYMVPESLYEEVNNFKSI